MIEKSRLQELIKQGATIYWLCGDFVSTTRLNNLYYISECNILCKNNINGKECVVYLKDLYETQKEAEWHLKYHTTRTEELNLPYWTDIVEHKDDDIYKIVSFRRRNGMSYNLLFRRGDLMLWSVQELMNVWIDLATEENYTELCDLCLKLFKGEV